jgi:hypothetical protein
MYRYLEEWVDVVGAFDHIVLRFPKQAVLRRKNSPQPGAENPVHSRQPIFPRSGYGGIVAKITDMLSACLLKGCIMQKLV